MILYCHQSANIYNCRMCSDILGAGFVSCTCFLVIKDIFKCNIFLIWTGAFSFYEISLYNTFLGFPKICFWSLKIHIFPQQIHPDDAFGEQMIKNLEVKYCWCNAHIIYLVHNFILLVFPISYNLFGRVVFMSLI